MAQLLTDDFDTPNSAPGYCPQCGMEAHIWLAVSQKWECGTCDWQGRQTNREKPEWRKFFVDKVGKDFLK